MQSRAHGFGDVGRNGTGDSAQKRADSVMISAETAEENDPTGLDDLEALERQIDDENDPTGLDDLEELERRTDAENAGQMINQITQSAQPPSNQQGGTGTWRDAGHVRGRGLSPLPWTDVQHIEVLRIYELSRFTTHQQRADYFNSRFPNNPPRSREAFRSRHRTLRNREETIASVQGKVNAAYLKDLRRHQ